MAKRKRFEDAGLTVADPICGKCGIIGADNFYPSALKGGATGLWCRNCQRAYYRQRTIDDREYFLKYQRRRRRTLRDEVEDYKVKVGCTDCGTKHPAVLDFHHKDATTKSFTVSQLGSRGKGRLADVMPEIEKCEVLCANCHRVRHYTEKTGHYTPWQGEADRRQKLA